MNSRDSHVLLKRSALREQRKKETRILLSGEEDEQKGWA